MRFKKRSWKIFLVALFSCSILLTTGMTIYFFGLKTMQEKPAWPLTQPLFQQAEINWITKEKTLIFSRFKELLESKIKGEDFFYFVDDYDQPTVIKVQNQLVNWVYQLSY